MRGILLKYHAFFFRLIYLLKAILPERCWKVEVYGSLWAFHPAAATEPALVLIKCYRHIHLFIPFIDIHRTYLIALLATDTLFIVYLYYWHERFPPL
jgi:hypothetical protein